MEPIDIESSSFLEAIYERAKTTSMIIMSTEGIIFRINKSFEENFGYVKEDLTGKYFSILFREADIEKGWPELELSTVLEHGYAIDDNYLVSKDGTNIWVHGESILAGDKSGQSYLVKIFNNINEIKSLERKLKERNEEQKRIINDRNNFIYAASHDLLAPINNIDGLIKHLALRSKVDSETEFIINMMNESIQKFRKTVRTLSSIGKLEEEAKSEFTDIAIREVFEEIIYDLQPDLVATKGIINHDFSEVPLITFSLKNLRSIMFNLLSNAIKYRHPDRVPEIYVKTHKVDRHYMMLSVQDNGIGIKPEDRESVFQMYKRVLKEEVHGTGVGLTLIKRIIDNEGGKIELESEYGKGSTFKVFLKVVNNDVNSRDQK